MTTPRRKPAEPGTGRRDAAPLVPDPRPREQEIRETREPHDLPFPGRWPLGRPEYVIVVDQLRGWELGQPSSLAELLETSRTREPEPDMEAEP